MKAVINTLGNIYSNEDATLTLALIVTCNGKRHAISANVATLQGKVEKVYGWNMLSAGKATKAMDAAIRTALLDYAI